MCMMFEIPTDGDLHIIGYIADIDNANVMHHIGVTACSSQLCKIWLYIIF